MIDRNIIELRGVEKRYGTFLAASEINLDLKEGELDKTFCGTEENPRL